MSTTETPKTATAPEAPPQTQALEKKKPWVAMSPKERKGDLQTKLLAMKPTLKLLVPKGWEPEKMIRLAIIACTNNPDLLNCTPVTFFRAVAIAAQLGLDPTGVLGGAYLVPFRNNKKAGNPQEVTFIAGYRGLIDLARRSGNISTITANVVYEGDKFEYLLGTEQSIKHVPAEVEPNEKGEFAPRKLTHVYAVAKLTDGSIQFVVLTRSEVEKVRNSSKSGGSEYSPWKLWTEEMWKKTAVKRLCKMLPMSVDLLTAIEADNRGEAGLSNEDLLNATIDLPEDALDDLRDPEPPTQTEKIKAKAAKSEQREPGEEG